MCRGRRPRSGADLLPRSTGSNKVQRARRSPKCLLVGAGNPGRERFATDTLVAVAAGEPLDVRGQPVCGRLEPAQFATEPRLVGCRQPETAAEVYLEALHHVAVRAGH